MTPPDPPRPDRASSRDGGPSAAAGFTPAIAWALIGVGLLFGVAIARLGTRGIATVQTGLRPGEWAALVVLSAVFVHTEGVRALQRRWGPHMIRRTLALRTEPRLGARVFAPLYALSLSHAPARELARAWAGLFAITAAVLLVRALPEPWRGIIDLAVALALTWGSIAMTAAAVPALRRSASGS